MKNTLSSETKKMHNNIDITSLYLFLHFHSVWIFVLKLKAGSYSSAFWCKQLKETVKEYGRYIERKRNQKRLPERMEGKPLTQMLHSKRKRKKRMYQKENTLVQKQNYDDGKGVTFSFLSFAAFFFSYLKRQDRVSKKWGKNNIRIHNSAKFKYLCFF